MKLKDILEAVQKNRIEFVTMRPPDSEFITLERQVIITGPPELVNLSSIGDFHVLDELIKILKEPDLAWTAIVLLAAMTRREEKMVESFSANPGEWWNSVGKTAYERWSSWLTETREKLIWDSNKKVFVERE